MHSYLMDYRLNWLKKMVNIHVIVFLSLISSKKDQDDEMCILRLHLLIYTVNVYSFTSFKSECCKP